MCGQAPPARKSEEELKEEEELALALAISQSEAEAKDREVSCRPLTVLDWCGRREGGSLGTGRCCRQ